MIRGAPIGKRFEHCTFENYEVNRSNREAVEACKRVAKEGKHGIMLWGKNGVGKTHLLVALMKEYDQLHSHVPVNRVNAETMIGVPSASLLIANAAEDLGDMDTIPSLSQDEIEKLAHIEYWPLLDLVSELRSDIAQGSLITSTRCRECDLLVLDDFGSERTTDFVLEELERIVDWRYRSMKPTAVATNLPDSAAVIKKYGSRALSRWIGSCYDVMVAGEDRRTSSERPELD
ncbi:ATP-binding protein [Candidatus Bipolaricaulota bacterium]|nr:ATP-binding protein [Candidatus Bipolaricaulota bacterium]